MKHCMLVPLVTVYNTVGDHLILDTSSRHQPRCCLTWIKKGEFVKQDNSFSCKPIACEKILEMFKLLTEYKVKLVYHANALRMLVTNEWKQFLTRFNDNLVVHVRELIALHEPVTEEGDLVLPSRNTSWLRTMTAPVIAAAVVASAKAHIDDAQLCFCCCDASNMELVMLVCCKQTIHWHYLLAYT